MAKLLLDENMSRSIGAMLAARGHDVTLVSDLEAGADDLRVLTLASARQSALVTFDSDFGELIFQQRAPPPPAVIYVRLHPSDVQATAALIAAALDGETTDLFIVCTRDGTRRRSMRRPPSADDGT